MAILTGKEFVSKYQNGWHYYGPWSRVLLRDGQKVAFMNVTSEHGTIEGVIKVLL